MTLSEQLEQVLGEANPWHDKFGRFSDESGAIMWSLGGKQRRLKAAQKKDGTAYKRHIPINKKKRR